MHPYPSHGTAVRNTTPSLGKFLRSLERPVFVARKLIPALSPITGKMEVRPAMTGETLNLGRERARRRRERRWDSQIRKAMGSAKAADRQFALHPEA